MNIILLAILHNFPNPFNSNTVIKFYPDKSEQRVLTIRDIRGGDIHKLHDSISTSSEHSMVWDETDCDGKPVASGNYLAEQWTMSDRVE